MDHVFSTRKGDGPGRLPQREREEDGRRMSALEVASEVWDVVGARRKKIVNHSRWSKKWQTSISMTPNQSANGCFLL